jgi:hypothetical protein
VQGERQVGGAAYHKGIHKKTSDLVGDSPQFFSVTAEESAAQAWHTACALGGKSFGRLDRQHLGLRFQSWRNSWQQWVLKKNMMR